MSLPTDTTVKWFSSLMSGAPKCANVPGSGISVLDACLLNGFGSVTVSSLVVSDGVATATVSAGHGFLDWIVILISGATPSELNGEKRLCPISATQFKFDATGVGDCTASGAITAKVAPLNWEKLFSGTNKAVYRRPSPRATEMLLRIDDSATTTFGATMYENMTDVDTGVGQTPPSTQTQIVCGRGTGADRGWRLFADDCTLYWMVDYAGTGLFYGGLTFGDIIPVNSADSYACVLAGGSSSDPNNYTAHYLNGNTTNRWIARSASQASAGINAGFISLLQSLPGQAGMAAMVNPADNSIHSSPIEIWDAGLVARRGILAGMLNILHNYQYQLDAIYDYPDINLGKAMIVICISPSRVLIPIIGPWR